MQSSLGLSVSLLFAATQVACASSSAGTGGAGGTGTQASVTATTTSVTSSKASSTASTTASSNTSVTVQVASSSGTSMALCDTGAHGSLLAGSTPAEQTICATCIQCSESHQCMSDWTAFAADPDHQFFLDCNSACMPSDGACITACSNKYPNADTLFGTALICSTCTECLLNCDAANSCA